MTTPTPPNPDDEMRLELMRVIDAHSFLSDPTAQADAALNFLRRRGCFFPGDPVTDAMVRAAMVSKCGISPSKEHQRVAFVGGGFTLAEMRAAITAALNARGDT